MTTNANSPHPASSPAEATNHEESDQDLDALLSSPTQETLYNSQRISQLQAQHPIHTTSTPFSSSSSTEIYTTLSHEKPLIEILSTSTSTSQRPTIVHFHLPTFTRCKTMDGHLEALARKHHHSHDSGTQQTRFFRVNVEHAPFLVDKFRVRVLPCVLGFRDGRCVERIVGFEGLVWGDGEGEGDGDGEKVRRGLERRFVRRGLLLGGEVGGEVDGSGEEEEEEGEEVERKRKKEKGKGIRGIRRKEGDDDEESDWD
ncbi:MAG: hypothetical protein M1816_000298 [Peltula sp. TS41687]|nr:MAG: hypothetical protein M1816_000298 [Peltula sp. TS41687]